MQGFNFAIRFDVLATEHVERHFDVVVARVVGALDLEDLFAAAEALANNATQHVLDDRLEEQKSQQQCKPNQVEERVVLNQPVLNVEPLVVRAVVGRR